MTTVTDSVTMRTVLANVTKGKRMSADNYYTIKFDPETLKWYPLQGFMSGLEEGIPALVREHSTGYDDWHAAMDSVFEEYAEYGVIQEPSPLDEILTVEQWRTHLENTLRLAQSHLDWINGDSDE
ncbi:hypothetical protein SEA_WATERT_63 [Microbacterium phage WaterT]|nr:hypothetical protein SEA_WATERT_63 [Microbacterium phage WaterT]